MWSQSQRQVTSLLVAVTETGVWTQYRNALSRRWLASLLTMSDTETHTANGHNHTTLYHEGRRTYMRLPCLHKSLQQTQVFLGSGSFYTVLAGWSHAGTIDPGLHRTSCRQPNSSILSLYQPTSSTHFINTIIVSTHLIIIMSIYHALINGLSAHKIHINLNMIFYTHVEHSPTKT